MKPISKQMSAALSYATRGWPVVPLHEPTSAGCSCGRTDCKSIGKHPRTRTGLKEASTDEEIVRKWWTWWPTANIGIVTGAVSNLLVLDVDPRHGGDLSLMELEAQHGNLFTARVITGSGGQHLYFQHPGGAMGNTQNKLGPGIDTRCDGGYVVAPGSVHACGGTYEWA